MDTASAAQIRRTAPDTHSGMNTPLQLFTRLRPGVWRCARTGQVIGPTGRAIRVFEGSTFRVGQTYVDWDIAKWLDDRLCEPEALETESDNPTKD